MTLLLQGAGLQAVSVAAPPSATAWNPADTSADIALSNGDLTATINNSGNYGIARSLTSKTAGKYYFQITFDVDASGGGSPLIGLANASQNLGQFLGGSNNGVGYFPADGKVYLNFSVQASLSTYTAGDTVGCAVDFDTGQAWFSKNDVFDSGDPAGGTGEHYAFTPGTEFYAACGLLGFPGGDAGTAEFAAPSSPPSGFGVWS